MSPASATPPSQLRVPLGRVLLGFEQCARCLLGGQPRTRLRGEPFLPGSLACFDPRDLSLDRREQGSALRQSAFDLGSCLLKLTHRACRRRTVDLEGAHAQLEALPGLLRDGGYLRVLTADRVLGVRDLKHRGDAGRTKNCIKRRRTTRRVERDEQLRNLQFGTPVVDARPRERNALRGQTSTERLEPDPRTVKPLRDYA
jgi:hypothetical protein